MIPFREPYNPQRSNTTRTVLPYPYIGLVKSNTDVQRMGRLSVWIPEICGDPTDQSSWIICSYCSPFAGATDLTSIPNYAGDPNVAQQSYGWVAVPPDLNSEVMVVFVAGEISRAYWTGCVYQQNMNHMVPGIAVDATLPPSTPVKISPVIEYNKTKLTGSPQNPLRPPYPPLTAGLAAEGLNSDLERGQASTSMRRESPPKVYGYLTPDGNTIHVDDNPQNEFIRLRTKSGTQVMISETTGFVYINSKNGNSWFEISDAGIDGFTMNSISLRAQQDLNIRADRNIVLDAGSNIFLRAGQEITMDIGTNLEIGVGNDLVVSAAACSIQTTGDLQLDAHGNLRFQSGADTTSLAGGNWLRQGSTIDDNGGDTPGTTTSDPSVPAASKLLDTTITPSTGVWRPNGGTVTTIVGRMPTHEPWSGHPRSNVPPPPTTSAPITTTGTYGQGSSSNVNPDGTLNDSGCNIGAAGTKPISTEVYNSISNAATKTGAPLANMLAFADVESSFQPGAGASSSSASGLYQFTSGTWNSMVGQYGNQYNVSPNQINDASANALMGGQLMQNDTATLQKNGISNPTPGQLYILHFMGSTGGVNLISAAQNNPDASAASLFPAAASANRSIFYNSDGSPKTTSQVYNNLTTLVDSKAAAYANQNGLPAPCDRQMGVAGNTPTNANTPPNPNAVPADYAKYLGTYVGQDQECVSLVKQVNNLPATSQWYAGSGDLVNNPPAVGTAIATFDPNGTYANSKLTSHAAIYMGPAPGGNGIQVLEQYDGQPAQIKNYYNTGTGISNANNYKIINTT